jgi:hypothetical protein
MAAVALQTQKRQVAESKVARVSQGTKGQAVHRCVTDVQQGLSKIPPGQQHARSVQQTSFQLLWPPTTRQHAWTAQRMLHLQQGATIRSTALAVLGAALSSYLDTQPRFASRPCNRPWLSLTASDYLLSFSFAGLADCHSVTAQSAQRAGIVTSTPLCRALHAPPTHTQPQLARKTQFVSRHPPFKTRLRDSAARRRAARSS